MRRIRLTIAAVCIVAGACLLGVQPWLDHVTAHGRPRALWRAALPGLDLGIDAWPAAPGQDGYIEVWYTPHDADDYQPLVRMPGAPALPLSSPARALPTPKPQQEPLPGELWT